MSRQQIASHYTRLFARWPKDVLRPEKSFPSILESRIKTAPPPPRNEEREVNAAYLLLENAFSKQYRPSEKLMSPMSNPDYYKALGKELQELPNRSVWGNFLLRLKSMVRMK